jgi:hypothetical protein
MKLFRSARLLLLAFVMSLVPASSFAGVFISIGIAPPVLPVYVQPPCPEDGYLWTPGYWAYGDDGYYWVPGAWVPAPEPGVLWTPPYWGWEGGHYLFHGGYWGPHIGYYGGVNYGFGYMGVGFAGGEWRSGHFFYNTAVMHVGGGFHNTYVNETIVHNTTIINNNHVAYSGGPGGIQHQPTAEERTAINEHHIAPTAAQQQHIQAAAHDPQQRFSANHGRPATVAAARPMAAPAHGAVAGHPAQASRPEARPAQQARPAQTARPAQEARPAQQARPAQEARPAQQARPAQEARPAQQARPAQEARPAAQPHAQPSRPAPRPQKEEKPKGR